jgi:hypothetical protein
LLAIISALIIACKSAPPTTPQSLPPTSDEPKISSSAKSFWSTDQDENPVTGVTSVYMYVLANGPTGGILYIRKRSGLPEIYIITDDFLETTENLHTRDSRVTYRFDGEKPIKQTWNLGGDNKTLFYRGNPAALISSIKAHKTLYFQYEPSDSLPKVITFDIEGLPHVLDSYVATAYEEQQKEEIERTKDQKLQEMERRKYQNMPRPTELNGRACPSLDTGHFTSDHKHYCFPSGECLNAETIAYCSYQ